MYSDDSSQWQGVDVNGFWADGHGRPSVPHEAFWDEVRTSHTFCYMSRVVCRASC